MTRAEHLALLRLCRLTLDDKQATTPDLKKRLDAAIKGFEEPYTWTTHRSGILRLSDPRVPETVTVIVSPAGGGWWNWAVEHDGLNGRSSSPEAAKRAALAALGME